MKKNSKHILLHAMRTPFGGMFRAIIDMKLEVGNLLMMTKMVRKVVAAYSEKDDTFIIAGKMIKLTPNVTLRP